MKTYLLRNIDSDLWRRFLSRLALDEKTVRDFIIEQITKYVNQTKGE